MARAAFKGDELAAMRSRLFRTASSGRCPTCDTEQVSNGAEKKKHSRVKQPESRATYTVSISMPWGGTRRYAVEAAGMSFAIDRAVRQDNRFGAVEDRELALIGVKREVIEPPMSKHEVRLLLNTGR